MPLSKMIETPEILWQHFKDYKEWVEENPRLIEDYVGKDADRVMRKKPRALTMEGFEEFVADIPDMPMELSQYFANREGRYEAFVPICSRIKRSIREDQISGGMAGIYNPSITQRLNGLVEKSETTVTVEQPLFGDDESSEA